MNPQMDRIAVLAPNLSGGGIERAQANLAGAFVRRGHPADMLFFDSEGPNPQLVSPAARVIDLRTECSWIRFGWFMLTNPVSFTVFFWHILKAPRPFALPYLMLRFMALVRYLRQESPTVIYAAGGRANLLAVQACRIVGGTRVVISQHNNMAVLLERDAGRVGNQRARAALWLLRRVYLRLPVAENIRPSMHSLHEIRGFRTEVACSSCSLPVKISHTRQWSSWPVIPAEAGIHIKHESL